MAVSKEKIKQKYLDHWQIPIKCYGVGYWFLSAQLTSCPGKLHKLIFYPLRFKGV